MERKRILGVSSGGGHWVELLRVLPAFVDQDVALATVHEMYRRDVESKQIRFYTVRDVTRWDMWRWPLVLAKLLWILVRERPDVVISTGALPGYFALRFAKLIGAKTIWLDSIANVEEMSMSGQMVRNYADLWLTQWPHLVTKGERGPAFKGAVL